MAVREDCLPEVVKRVTFLLAAGFGDGQDALNKATARLRLSAVGDTAPDHGCAQSAFGAVVSRLNARMRGECPQGRLNLQDEAAGFGRFGMRTTCALDQHYDEPHIEKQAVG